MYYEAIFMNKEKKCRDTEDDESVYGWKLASVQQYTPLHREVALPRAKTNFHKKTR
jgi:hypothetical protein